MDSLETSTNEEPSCFDHESISQSTSKSYNAFIHQQQNRRSADRRNRVQSAHPWFKGIDWDRIYHMEVAFIPEVKNELDTQNFEKFEESNIQAHTSSKSGPWRKMISFKDINFDGYTYKNFEIMDDYQVLGMGLSLSLSHARTNFLAFCYANTHLNLRGKIVSRRGQQSNHCLRKKQKHQRLVVHHLKEAN